MEQSPKHPKAAKLFSALLEALDISANKLAKEISMPGEDYSQQVISNYATGRNKPGQEVLAAIARRYPAVSTAFLLTGEGEPFPGGRYNEKPAPSKNTTEEKPEGDDLPPAGGMVLSHSLERMLASMSPQQRADYWRGRYETDIDAAHRREQGLLDRLAKKLNASVGAAAHQPHIESTVHAPAARRIGFGVENGIQLDFATGQRILEKAA